ncbi:hypothetical protein [Streptomyces broussonetiae]|uniref:Uncharacterized protein n=1 Tax=Streptomyces broussonetiae TaxID=2686304 RepID=A0ABV5EDD1_9ACTN
MVLAQATPPTPANGVESTAEVRMNVRHATTLLRALRALRALANTEVHR